MEKKFGIALGSGGARGIAHLGFLEVLKENDVGIDCICGASMGSIIGALYSIGADVSKIIEVIEKLKMRHIADFDPLFYWRRGFFRTNKAEKLLYGLLEDKTFEDCRIPFSCSGLDLISGKVKKIDSGSLQKAVMASSAIPGVFQPVTIGENYFVDGGTINKVPVDMCRSMGADVVLGIDVLGEIYPAPMPKNLEGIIERAFLIMNYHTGETERHRADKLIVLEQDHINPARVENLYDSYVIGREAATAHLDEIRRMSESCREEA